MFMRIGSYTALFFFAVMFKWNSLVPESESLELIELAEVFGLSICIALAQIIYSLYKEKVSMFSFVCSMVSLSSLMYFFAKWGLYYPTFSATEMASNFWIFLLLSALAFIVSRRTKTLPQEA